MKDDNWHRRHAMVLASQLPDRKEDALAVLRLTTELVTGFYVDDESAQKPALTVVRIGGNESA
jgi:hypothetical protein